MNIRNALETFELIHIDDILYGYREHTANVTDADKIFLFIQRELDTLISGHPFCLFTEQGSGEGLIVQYGYPVTRTAVRQKIKFTRLPGTSLLTMTHKGSHETLGESWEKLFDFIYRKNLRTGCWRREVYLTCLPDIRRSGWVELQVSIRPDTDVNRVFLRLFSEERRSPCISPD